MSDYRDPSQQPVRLSCIGGAAPCVAPKLVSSLPKIHAPRDALNNQKRKSMHWLEVSHNQVVGSQMKPQSHAV